MLNRTFTKSCYNNSVIGICNLLLSNIIQYRRYVTAASRICFRQLRVHGTVMTGKTPADSAGIPLGWIHMLRMLGGGDVGLKEMQK